MKKKIAVLFPGIGYTCDKPLLYYTGKLAVARGYKLVKVEYGNFPSGIKENKEKMEEAFRCGLEQAEKILQDICWEEYADLLKELKENYSDFGIVVKKRMNYDTLRENWR